MILAKGTDGILPKTLSSLPGSKGSYIVDRVTGPEQRRLCELGMVEGAPIDIVNRATPGMMVVRVGGCRLALARGMADFVVVK